MDLLVAVPVSTVTVEPGLEMKTIKIGQIVRSLAIFRVKGLVVYLDRAGDPRDIELVKTVVSYMITAPYLRRRVFPPNNPYLRYAGVLPPLQLETHGAGGPRVGEVRQALVISKRGDRVVVDAGLGKPVEVKLSGVNVKRGQIIHVRIESLGDRPKLAVIDELDPIYTGFTLDFRDGLMQAIRLFRSRGCSLIATSRKGVSVVNIFERLVEVASKASCLAVLFGAPDKGLYEIAGDEGIDLEKEVDMVVNTIPGQGVLRVRTEEALTATLAIVNLAKHMAEKRFKE